MAGISEHLIADGLAFIDALDRVERTAFLAMFAGARCRVVSFNGERPSFGKAECEWVEEWRDFYGVRLSGAGLVAFEEEAPKPALGMHKGSTYINLVIAATGLGYAVREAWWKRWNEQVDAAAEQA